jgi:hypothetical protein
MINLLEQIRAALDELEPRLEGRVVDIEMPRLFVVADEAALRRELVELIGRAVEQSDGHITVRTTKERTAARVEVSGDAGPVVWLTVPLSGGNAPE